MIGVQVEAMFTKATIRYKFGSGAPPGLDCLQFGFSAFSVPVYARFDIALGVYALAGLQIDMTVGDTWVKGGDPDNSLLLSVAAGAGVNLPAGPGAVDVGAGIKYGIIRPMDDMDMWLWDIDIQIAYGFSL